MDPITLNKLTGEQTISQSKTLDDEENVRIRVDAKLNDNIVEDNVHTGVKEVRVFSESHICLDNSTNISLGSNGVFVGAYQDTLNYSEIIVSISTDQNSAEDGLVITRSSDGITPDETDEFSILGSHGKTFTFPANRRFVKVQYTNGSIAQTKLNIQTILKRFASKGSSHRIKDSIVGDDDAILSKSILTAKDENGNFVNIGSRQGEHGDNLNVSLDQTEPTTNSIKTMDYSHAELHSGDRYVSRGTESLAGNTTKNLLIVTPNTTRWAHMTFEASGENGEVEIALYEACVTSNNGTRDNERNRNRNYPDNNATFVFINPVITSNGNLISQQTAGAGKSTGGQNRDNNEFLLKQNTKYLFYIKNNTVSANKINRTIDRYEHTNIA